MTATNWLDLALIVLTLAAALSGWVNGAAASAFALLGVGIGVVSGLLVAPHLVAGIGSPLTRLVAGLAIVAVMVTVGQIAGVTLGRAARRYISGIGARIADSVVGALLQSVAALLVVWLVAIPVSAQESSPVAAAVRGSSILEAVDAAAPDRLHSIPAQFSNMIGDTGFPDILGPFGSTPLREVPPPDPALAGDAVVQRVRPSVVKVLGRAGSCQRSLEGSGFVVEPGTVVTNAHVVAGTDSVRVETSSGTLPATVVHYDSSVDIAILRVDGLAAAPLPMAEEPAPGGTEALVVGYPGNGPFTAEPVRVRELVRLRGPNIYRDATVEREVYTLRGSVREGNSGGPVVDAEGRVIGVVFGAAMDASDTGYALTNDQVRPQIDAGRGVSAKAPTGQCVGAR